MVMNFRDRALDQRAQDLFRAVQRRGLDLEGRRFDAGSIAHQGREKFTENGGVREVGSAIARDAFAELQNQ